MIGTRDTSTTDRERLLGVIEYRRQVIRDCEDEVADARTQILSGVERLQGGVRELHRGLVHFGHLLELGNEATPEGV
jgi:hypothetical protein